MPHPQDVAVPSLPLSETLALAIKLGVANVDFEEQAEIDGFLHTFGNACYEAGRAAGRASAEPEGAQAEPVADARRFVYDEHVRPLRAGDDGSFPGLSWYDFGSSRMHPCVINARGRTILRDGDWIALIGTQYHAFTPEVYALLSAPTPTASIATKAEAPWEHLKQYGYAPGGYLSKCHACEKVVEFVDKRAITCRPCAEAMHAAPKAEGEALHKFINAAAGEGLVLDGVDAADLYIELWPAVGEPSHPQAGAAEFNAAMACAKVPGAPAAQAAAGASDDVLAKLRWVDHVLGEVRQQVAAIESLSYGRACDKLKEVIAALSPRPEADADRASGGGV